MWRFFAVSATRPLIHGIIDFSLARTVLSMPKIIIVISEITAIAIVIVIVIVIMLRKVAISSIIGDARHIG
jgi:hypothetical protein